MKTRREESSFCEQARPPPSLTIYQIKTTTRSDIKDILSGKGGMNGGRDEETKREIPFQNFFLPAGGVRCSLESLSERDSNLLHNICGQRLLWWATDCVEGWEKIPHTSGLFILRQQTTSVAKKHLAGNLWQNKFAPQSLEARDGAFFGREVIIFHAFN